MSCTQEWRKCYICGDEVLWQTNGIGWHPIQYHDCKPVPGARLEQAERERDEARAEVARLRHDPKADARAVIEEWRAKAESAWSDAAQAQERLKLAVALLREAPDKACDCEEGRTCGSCEYNTRKDAFLAGQPAPVKAEVDDAVVERACAAMWNGVWPHDCVNPDDQRNDMRAALVAALEGRT